MNKSFKFQSDWPYNNSQIYLISSILEDLLEDEDREVNSKGDNYYFTSSVHYPNNKSLVKQKVYMNKDANITKAEVVDKDDKVQIIMEFKTIEYDKKFDKNYFELNQLLKINNKEKESTDNSNNNENTSSNTNNSNNDSNNNSNSNNNENDNSNTNDNNNSNANNNVNENTESKDTNNNSASETKTTASIDDIIYPMYLPNNTYLTSQEKVNTDNGERLILTFGGDSSFVLVEETVSKYDNSVIIPVNGEFDFLADVIGIISTNSLSWHSSGIDYYMTSNTISTSELIEIAKSISVLPVSK